MSGNLLPLFLNPVPTNANNGVSGSVQIGSKAPLQFDSNVLFGSLLSQAMNATPFSGAVKPLANAALSAVALGDSNAASDLGTLLMNKIAATFHTDAAGLQAQIQHMLANGQSMASITAQLASALAGTVSDAVSLDNGSSGIIARNRLMQAFSQALAPPGTAPPNAAQGAAALAQRFAQVANIVAAGATQSQDVGQQYRYPGSNLDAITAKVSPAPDASTTDPSPAASALASSIQATLTAALPAPPSSSPTTANMGTSSLQARISALLASGASTDAVVKTLASTLGNTVAAATGADNAATASLQAAFAQRLSAPKGGTPDWAAAQIAAQATAIVQQSAAQITSGVTAGQAVAALAPSVVSSTPGGSDVLQRTLQRAQNAAIVAHGAVQPQSSTPSGVSASGGQGGANTGNSAGNANVNTLLAQVVSGGSTASSSVDAFLRSFTQAMTDLRNREHATASVGPTSPASVPSNGTQAFLASIGSVDPSQNAMQIPEAPIGAPNPADPNNVVDQVLKGIFLRNAGDATEVRMKLQPANLGDVHVKLNVNNGNVSAIIIASTAEVRDTLLANQNQLSRHFADAGLKLQQFSVDVGGGQGNPFAQQQSSSNGRASSRGMLTSADEAEGDAIQSAIPTFGPPILAGVNRGLLDYLV